MNFTCIVCRYTSCANIHFLDQGFQNLSSDRETDTTDIIYHVALQVVNKQQLNHMTTGSLKNANLLCNVHLGI